MDTKFKIAFLTLMLQLLTHTSFGQNAEMLEQLSASMLTAFDESKSHAANGKRRLYLELQDSMDVDFARLPDMLELNVRSSFSNHSVYTQLRGLNNLRVLSFRPTLEICRGWEDADPCIMAHHRIFPGEYSFPGNLLILDAGTPFIQRIPDRVLSECADLRIILIHKMHYADLPVAFLKLNGLHTVVVEASAILPAERIFFETYAPSIHLNYGLPEWIRNGEIDYSNKIVRKILLKKVKERKPPGDSDFTLYFKEGGVAVKGSFNGGNPSGNWELYNTSGVVIRKRSYSKEGLRAGTWEWFNDRGELIYDESYNENGIRSSAGEYMQHNGVYLYRKQWFNGTNDVAVKTYYPDGTLESEYGLYGSDYHGAKKEYYPNGRLKEESHYWYGSNTYSPATLNFDANGNVLHKIERVPPEGSVADSLRAFLQTHQVELPGTPSMLRKSTKIDPLTGTMLIDYTYLLPNDDLIAISSEYKTDSVNPQKTDILLNRKKLKSIRY